MPHLTREQAMEVATKEDVKRLEDGLSKLTEMMGQLIRIEERQTQHADVIRTHGQDIEYLKREGRATREELAKWINRGVGLWAALTLVFLILNAPSFIKSLHALFQP
jgi:uncharacterized protein with von Willebrand factor type A (vWA) domain